MNPKAAAKWDMRRLLLTGGAGFIGSHFAFHCLQRGLVDRLVVLDSLTYAADPSNVEPLDGFRQFRFVRGDICDRSLVERLLREEALDCILNFAAETHVDRSIQSSDEFFRSNVAGTRELLEAARRVPGVLPSLKSSRWLANIGPCRKTP